MSTINQSFEITKREDIVLEFSLDTAGSIAGYEFIFEMKYSGKSSTQAVDIYKETDDGIEVMDEDEGVIHITIDSADTNTLKSGMYNWELWRSDGANRKLLAEGKANILSTIRVF